MEYRRVQLDRSVALVVFRRADGQHYCALVDVKEKLLYRFAPST